MTSVGLVEEEGVQADVFFDADMYDAVVAAAFGGVKVNLDKDASMIVHPFWLFLCCVPLWVLQLSAVCFLRLDEGMNLELNVHSHADHEKATWTVMGNSLLVMQIMFVIVVQAMLFKELLGALRLLVFVLNPSTWTDIRRPDPTKMRSFFRFMFNTAFVAPFPVIAMLLKTYIGYSVCVDSISIILACETEKTVIFDSLVITFIADLDVVVWNVASTIFHLDDFSCFVLKTAPKDFVVRSRQSVYLPRLHKLISPLRRAEHGRTIESFLAFAIMWLLYSRQLLVVFYAFDTNVLPMARDVCTFWRWETGKERHATVPAMMWRFVERHVLFVDIHERLRDIGGMHGFCESGKYDRMLFSDQIRIFFEYPSEMIGLSVSLMMVFIAPQVIFIANTELSREWKELDDDEYEFEDDEGASLRKQLESLRSDVDFLLSVAAKSGQSAPRKRTGKNLTPINSSS
jgi:hypothetical protein